VNKEENDASRREFVKKAAYVAPVIVTLAVMPSYAKAGSGAQKGQGQNQNGQGQNQNGQGQNGQN
jgi:hypothetical protein